MNQFRKYKQWLAILLVVVLGITATQVETVYAEEDIQTVVETDISSDNEEESVSETESKSDFLAESTTETKILDETIQTSEIENTMSTETQIETELFSEIEGTDELGEVENTMSAETQTETEILSEIEVTDESSNMENDTDVDETETETEINKIVESEEETEGTDAVIVDAQTAVLSNMKEECMPYLLWSCELKDSVVMGGTTYADAIQFLIGNFREMRAGFNLNGIYKTVSFSVGHIDGMQANANNIVLKIYRDKKEGERYELSNNDIPQTITCNVEGTRQFEIVFECKSSYSYFGIGAINFTKESNETSLGKVIHSNMKEQKCEPYNKSSCEIKDSVVMGGTTYTDAIEFLIGSFRKMRAGFNLNGIYKTISFSVGHIDGEQANAEDIILKIYRDGKEGESYQLYNNDIPSIISCNVEGTRQFEIVFECKSSYSYFGIGALNFTKKASVETPIAITDFNMNPTAEGIVNQPFLTSGTLTLSGNGTATLEDFQKAANAITWTSTDERIAKITNCTATAVSSDKRSATLQLTITPYKAGTATITGTTSNGLKANLEVIVKSESETDEMIADFSIDPIGEVYGSANMLVNTAGRLKLANGTSASKQEIQREVDAITWRSAAVGGNSDVARVTKCGTVAINGNTVEFPITIICLKEGKTTITGTTSNGKEASFQISFYEEKDTTTYTVYFDTKRRGTAPAPYQNVKHGSTIKAPTEPKAQGYIFTGWYKDDSCTLKWDFSKDVVTNELTLYAGWKVSGGEDDNAEGVLPEDIPVGGIPSGLWIAGISDYMYTGRPVKQQIRVYYNNVRLKEGWDYTVSYKNNTKAASSTDKKAPTITVKAKNGYEGTKFGTFSIRKLKLTQSNLIYTAINIKGQANTPVVIAGGKVLKANTDYTLTYSKNGRKVKTPSKPGSYEIHVRGKNNCEGEFTVPYTILDADTNTNSIKKAKIRINNMTFGKSIPKATLTIGGQTLRENTDYSVTYVNTDAKGTATAIFQGKGKYSGVTKKTFKVSAAKLPGRCITITGDTSLKKGGAKPQITVQVDGVKLVAGVDYTVSYKNNKKAGKQATVIVKGKGNYSGTQKATFTVKTL